ncbi:hypothetical protein Bca52824_033099 [Brassica carinata]|uniref:Uncharacterized protein n=1 Tax=Brassica carinata TaxID=52824 RepID=A0A8X7SBT0_BRACI|nr:hypothetical protein Bca52824_033099 [Brassica carinata]
MLDKASVLVDRTLDVTCIRDYIDVTYFVDARSCRPVKAISQQEGHSGRLLGKKGMRFAEVFPRCPCNLSFIQMLHILRGLIITLKMICLELEYLKLNHPGLAACGVTEEATWAISGVHEEPVWGGVTAEGATLKEDVRNIKNTYWLVLQLWE